MTTNYRAPQPKPPWSIHPIWRGIGCFMMVLLPVISYALASIFMDANARNGWLPLPAELVRTVTVPYLGAVQSLYGLLLFTVVFLVMLFSIFTVIYSIVYRITSPGPDPTDAPPPKRSRRNKGRRR